MSTRHEHIDSIHNDGVDGPKLVQNGYLCLDIEVWYLISTA